MIDQASLVIGECNWAVKEGSLLGYKLIDGKYYPRDMDVVRATTGTRVNSAGLVELVPYNLLTYSNTFSNAAWGTSQATLTSGQTGYDGSSNAYKLQATGTSCYIVQGSYDFTRNQSVYAKAGNYNQLSFIIGGYGTGVRFNLTTGTIADNTNTSYFTPTIESVGNGWYRCSVAISSTAPTYGFLFAPNYVASGNSTSGDYIYIQNAQLVEGSTALPYQKTETRLNIPRLDYSNGTCPSLLVEPQRTNGQEYSEDLTQTSFWAYGAVSISANQIVSPSGILNADKVIEAATTARHELYSKVYNFTGSNACSFFIKSAGRQYISVLSGGDPSLGGATFDVVNGLVTYTSGSSNATIEDFGDGWFKCSFTTTRTGSSQIYWCFRTISATPDVETYAGDGTSGFYIWGAQLEVGSYPTSYIPTTSASVTRNADVISKTGISSLIGQTEGTIFIDTYIDNIASQTNDPVLFYLRGVAEVYIEITPTGRVYGVFYNGTTSTGFINANIGLQNGRHKMAFGYKDNDFVLYVDGTQVGTDTSGTVSGSLTEFGLQYYQNFYVGTQDINAAALWQTRLTNTQLAALTTI